MAAKPPLHEHEVERVLSALQPLTGDRAIVVLIGGQAVAFWTRFLGPRSREIYALAPLASKDIDFAGSARAARRAATLLGGLARIATLDDQTPNTGDVWAYIGHGAPTPAQRDQRHPQIPAHLQSKTSGRPD